MGRSIATMLSVEKGRRSRRPLIVAMSLQPPIPQRVARQQSPPPLRRPGAMLRLGKGDCQHPTRPESTGLQPPGRGLISDPETYKFRHAFRAPQAISFQRLKPSSPRNSPTDFSEEPVFSHSPGRFVKSFSINSELGRQYALESAKCLSFLKDRGVMRESALDAALFPNNSPTPLFSTPRDLAEEPILAC